MRLLAISEHYFPRVGGTVNYVHETLNALTELGVEVELLVPGPQPQNFLQNGCPPAKYSVNWIGSDYPEKGDPSREVRYNFCRQVNLIAHERAASPDKPQILHVMFGLFVMELLDTARLSQAGVPSLATVHNVPPMECRQITHTAGFHSRLREALRLQLVAWKNRNRLRRNRFDLYITPSQQVADILTPIVRSNVQIIGHGTTSDLLEQMAPPVTRNPANKKLKLLTVGGYAPHKSQHIIPEAAVQLQNAGLDFRWDVVGPSGRVAGYYDTIAKDVIARKLQDHVILHQAIAFNDLGALYDQAHIYVQPSIEEGFCLTALDAAAVGLPVIGGKAGALPQIISASGGIMVESTPTPLATAILAYVKEQRWSDAAAQASKVRHAFSWNNAAAELKAQYSRLTCD